LATRWRFWWGAVGGDRAPLAGRHAQQAPEVDGLTYVNDGVAFPGEIVGLEITDASDYDLVGRVVRRDPARARQKLPAAKGPAPRKRGLNVLH
jgi:ribosomal protein S12 methylthiotransferase